MALSIVTRVTKRINAPASAVWKYLSWTGVEKLRDVSIIDHITIADDEPVQGAVRTLHLKDGTFVSEYLVAFSEAERRYTYRPTELGSLPVSNLTGRVEVRDEEGCASIVTIQSECTPVGISATEWQKTYTEVESAVIEFVRRHTEHEMSAS